MEYTAHFESFIDHLWYGYNNDKIKLIPYDYKNYIFDEKNTIMLIYSKLNK